MTEENPSTDPVASDEGQGPSTEGARDEEAVLVVETSGETAPIDQMHDEHDETDHFPEQIAGQPTDQEDEQSPAFDPKLNTLADIHKTFSTVIDEFRGDKSAERFMEEYEKLYEALKKTHREMKALQFKCANLQAEIKNNTEKVNLAIHLSQEDRGMISTLNRQMQEAWALVDVMSDREAKAKAAVTSMKEEIAVLTSLVEEGMGMDELQSLSEKAAAERKGLEEVVQEMKEDNEAQENKFMEGIGKLKEREQGLETEVKDLKALLETMKNQNEEDKIKHEQVQQLCNKLTRQGKRLKNEKSKLEGEILGKKKKLKKTDDFIAELQQEISKNTKSLKFEKEQNHQLQEEMKSMKARFEQFNVKSHHQTEIIESMEFEAGKMRKDITLKNQELKETNEKCKKLEYNCKKMELQNKNMESRLSGCDSERKLLMSELQNMSKCLDSTMKGFDSLTHKHNTMSNQHSAAMKNILTLNFKKKDLETSLRNMMSINRDMMEEMTNINESMKRISETVHSMVSEKDRLLRKMNQKASTVIKLEEEILTKDNLMLMAQKSKVETEHTLRLTRESLVHALNQRDNLANCLRKLEVMNGEFKFANQTMAKQIKSVSYEVQVQEMKVTQLSKEKAKMKEDLNEVHNLLIDEQGQNKVNKVKMRELQKSIQNLESLLNKSAIKIEQHNLFIEELIAQRNILGLQCVRKKEEVAMLMEKNQVLEDIMAMGNKLYDARLSQIQYLQDQNADLYRQKHIIMRRIENLDNFRSKLGLANQQLVQYQARCKAMEGEAMKNIHSWRHLKAKDMSKFEMVLKIQHLTKRLIVKSEDVAHLEGALKEKMTVLDHMKKQLARSPGVGIIERANGDRKDKERMKRKLKVALAEINMVEWKAQEREEERDKLKVRLEEERRKRLTQGKRFQKEKEKGFLPPLQKTFTGRCEDPAGLPVAMGKDKGPC